MDELLEPPSVTGDVPNKRKLKLDLHTHLNEASMIDEPTIDLANQLIKLVKQKGLDGIACTEHWDFEYGMKLKAIIHEYFDDEIIFIPGQEVDERDLQIVELFLSNGKIFRFIAHPGQPSKPSVIGDHVHGIEIDNLLHNWHIDKQDVRDKAVKYNLLMLRNSDAHYMGKIGLMYSEVSLEDLFEKSEPLLPTR